MDVRVIRQRLCMHTAVWLQVIVNYLIIIVYLRHVRWSGEEQTHYGTQSGLVCIHSSQLLPVATFYLYLPTYLNYSLTKLFCIDRLKDE